MKKILLSLAVVVLVGSVAAGATAAYFSASGAVTGNTVATGTLLLDVNKGAGKAISLSNIQPGYADSSWRWFDAYNHGSLPAEYFMRFDVTAGDTGLYNALNIELRDGGYTGACDGPAIYNGSLSAWVANSKISQYNVHAYASDSSRDAVLDDIRPGYTMRVCQKISFPDSLTDQNALQGKSVTFTETVNAMQDASPDLLP